MRLIVKFTYFALKSTFETVTVVAALPVLVSTSSRKFANKTKVLTLQILSCVLYNSVLVVDSGIMGKLFKDLKLLVFVNLVKLPRHKVDFLRHLIIKFFFCSYNKLERPD